jgi:exo-beta-1,3-glucanase (GH17 family)
MRFPLIAVLCALIMGAWYWPNRPQDPPGGRAGEKFSSLSFDAYRPWESPLTKRFPTEAEVDEDLALLASQTNAVRTYAAYEGDYDTAALAKAHGVKLWQGIWLSGTRADNEREMARGILLANKYPDTITRVIVGNEVLLRRDLPPAELIADIDRVKAAVRQPVAYADVWNFWLQFPEVAPHVDIMMIHLLPYWEDVPTGIDGAVAEVGRVYRQLKAAFPGKQIVIGETGWPSRGRQRADAVPSLVNETRFLRDFTTLSHAEHFDYNFIEAFDQVWKYHSEGIVGASWGIFNADRTVKIPLSGPVENDPDWAANGIISIVFGLGLCWLGFYQAGKVSRALEGAICIAGMLLGGALGYAEAQIVETLFDVHLMLAGAVNFFGQTMLASLAMMRLNNRAQAAPDHTGAHTTEAVRALLLREKIPELRGCFEDLCFLFAWTAAVMQMLLLFDPRYREFPLSTFAVPLLVAAGRLIIGDLPRHNGGREELVVGLALVIGAAGSAIQEGPLNTQSLVWNVAVLLLALGPLLRFRQGRKQFFFEKKHQKTFAPLSPGSPRQK